MRLIRNAGPVSNFSNDVVGDISGIGTTLALRIIKTHDIKNGTIITIFMTAIIASLTVGGKSVALLHYEEITYSLAKFINVVERIFNIELFPNKKTKERRQKLKRDKDKF